MLEKENFYNLRNRDVKRMLWPVDHEQIKQDLKKEEQRMKKELTEKYNFDFESDEPLHGKYKWVPVGSESPISSPCFDPIPSCSTRNRDSKTSPSQKKKRPAGSTQQVAQKRQRKSLVSSPERKKLNGRRKKRKK